MRLRIPLPGKLFAEYIIQIIKEHKGKQRYSIHFVDRANKMSCVMHPSKGSINAAEVFELLRDADYVTYDLKK